ncbi:uncharacterized protein LOC132695750 [Cylas formicarius]|uniref:uncharacterized protein LOC132695750 n=1 Tax=Cylas formicarius TaxID=197179 RepID=UPI0029588F1F|nr:uncharacterized protein LOC132695750 [Cylas formicarius]
MGNIGSHTGQISTRLTTEEQWTHSFPKSQHTRLQHKVLPERDVFQKLRHTDNGEILQSGGTLSGRHQLPPTIESQSHVDLLNGRSYLPAQRYSFHKTGYRSNHYIQSKQNAASQKALKSQMKLFGSEPDLRFSTQVVPPEQEMKERKTKKKYKAPPPPISRAFEQQSREWDENSSDEFPIRRARLFKTRAETKKETSHVNKLEQVDKYEDAVRVGTAEFACGTNRLSLPEMKFVECAEFQKELKEATERFRNAKLEASTTDRDRTTADGKEKLKTLDPKNEYLKNKFKQIVEIEENNNNVTASSLGSPRGEPSGKESSTPEPSPNMKMKDRLGGKPKSFYFGMDETNVTNYRIDTVVPQSSESDISTDIEGDDVNDETGTGIDLRLRPILPKKQLEIPRFSPAAAWKLLSSVELNDDNNGTLASDDVPVMIEETIEKYSRPPPPDIQLGPRSNDKSGDSGISGDAGPVGCDETLDSTKKGPSFFERKISPSWTPQQDLEEDSSLEELNLETPLKSRRLQLNRPHVFSLSLPRDNQLAVYMADKTSYHQYTGLQKIKRSVSGVLNNLSHKKDLTQSNANPEEGNNWFFSKSAPNSLEIRHNENEQSNFTSTTAGHKSSTSRVMYLPEMGRKSPELYKLSAYSKSCEDLTQSMVPEPLQDPPPKTYDCEWKPPIKKPKKFTFQSTVRQIERRRMAEKLSKEAERKEKQRLRELEAMQRVEEEFQKKRAKEKASIRQQLRLFYMEDNHQMSSLPLSLESKSRERPEPDGALSSTSSSPTPAILNSQELLSKTDKNEIKVLPLITQELSEYRQVQRDYKEYRGNMKYTNENRYTKQTTVHPKVTCNMPKAKGSNLGKGNYRKDFAYGVKSIGSTYSEESQNNSPKTYHNKLAPITRF